MRRLVPPLSVLVLAACTSTTGASPSPPAADHQPSPSSSPSPSPSGGPAQQQLDRTIAAALGEGTTHLRIDQIGTITGSTDHDAGPLAGSSLTALTGLDAEARCGRGSCWVTSGPAGLTSLFGLTAVQARHHAGRWVQLVPADRAYAAVRASTTLDVLLDNIRLVGTITDAGPSRFDGLPVEAIKGTDHTGRQSETVYVQRQTQLPVGFLMVTRDETFTGHFSRWGIDVRIEAPAVSSRLG